MHMNSKVIPLYELYGESVKTSKCELVHIEEIEQRSKEMNWCIKPHRHSKLFQIVCVKSGVVEVTIEDKTSFIKGGALVFVPASTVHGFRFKSDSIGFVLSINTSLVIGAVNSYSESALKELIRYPKIFENIESSEELNNFITYSSMLKSEFSLNCVSRDSVLENLTGLCLLSLARHESQKNNSIKNNVHSHLMYKFWTLLETHYRDHWSVADYAKQLCVSTSTLSRLCHNITGNNPKQIVHDRLLIEARRRLLHTQQTLEYIACFLGFKDQAYFSRFFKVHEGVAPSTYRKSLQQ